MMKKIKRLRKNYANVKGKSANFLSGNGIAKIVLADKNE